MAGLRPELIAAILLSGRAGRRRVAESAVQIDVWQAYAADWNDPNSRPGTEPQTGPPRVDLLMTPLDDAPSAPIAKAIYDDLEPGWDGSIPERRRPGRRAQKPAPRLTPLEGTLVATLDFEDFLRAVLPRTGYDLRLRIDEIWDMILTETAGTRRTPRTAQPAVTTGMLLAFASSMHRKLAPEQREALVILLIEATRTLEGRALTAEQTASRIPVAPAFAALRAIAAQARVESSIWRVARNRRVEPTMRSFETVKADAAMRVFSISCSSLNWAVIDSGIDGSHPAFVNKADGGRTIRIVKALNFGLLRDIASFDALASGDARLLLEDVRHRLKVGAAEARDWLAQLAKDVTLGRPYDWERLSALIEVDPEKLPDYVDGHGTHVAGVLAGHWEEEGHLYHEGICPDLNLFDLRILGADAASTEFAVVAALEYVRWVNARNRRMTIQGVNISLGLRPDLTVDACGGTTVCKACNDTVNAGVVVVAAAGNWGAENHTTLEGTRYAGYGTVSIADPGNAELVITVGATHRDRPHEYGVSYFSSRGPTGDGRAKPDVVAPGEKIDGPLPNLGYASLDGTSMASPHVSGVAALLMARNPELIGDPLRVKQIIMKSATDLGRIRDFQGAGLVDALRALQMV